MTFSKKFFLHIVCLSLALLFCYWFPIKLLVYTWISNPNYSFCLFVPIIAIYLGWTKRELLSNISIISYYPAIIFLIISCIILLLGELGSQAYLARISIVLTVFSIILFCYGKQVVKILLFPILFLICMIPLPSILQNRLLSYLKLLSTRTAFYVLNLLNIPASMNGNVINLGFKQLQIANPCSGLRYVLPLMIWGIIYSYFYQKSWWKRIIIVLLSIPLAMLSNTLRLLITAIILNNDPRFVKEPFHSFYGIVIFLLACMILVGFDKFFMGDNSKTNKQVNTDSSIHLNIDSKKNNTISKYRLKNFPVLISVIILIITGCIIIKILVIDKHKILSANTTDLLPVPLQVKDWHGKVAYIDPVLRKVLDGNVFRIIYTNHDSNQHISLYVNYFIFPYGHFRKMFVHIPQNCFRANGWHIFYVKRHRIRISKTKDINVQSMFVDNGEKRLLVYFWYQTRTREEINPYFNKLGLAIDAIRGNFSPLFIIRVNTPVSEGVDIPIATKTLDDFVVTLEKYIFKYWQIYSY